MISIFAICLILLLWFNTNFWLEYCKLFHLNSISKYKEYEIKKHSDPLLSYHEFLKIYYNNFFIRLVLCPICLSVWLSIISSVINNSFILIPIYTILSLLLYLIINKLYGNS
mgnify:CR=1 FL=1